ncbi:hypothetical protein FBZ89_14214 [Nitrospirillum amazonense]|uniref:Uncharacterized protein n=1 Tax=Nitrospirillum amazonense TaxID=28077 RepID=A0A560EIY0_9PROT|nr:hypothetical protein [Nitrospirillum amazonense]TWB09330.1 hypothetical protein FBZ89_14214 [Nitrospirillum amazonense]
MSQNIFPFPKSGKTTVRMTGAGLFEVECVGVDKNDYQLLEGFFNNMQGRFREFQFEHGGSIYPKCRFDSDSATFTRHGPNTISVTFPIKILPGG